MRRSWHEERVAPDDLPVARAVRRLDELLPRPRRAVAHRHGREDARAARDRDAAALHRGAALVRGQGQADRARARSPTTRVWERRRRELAAAAARDSRAAGAVDAISCRSRSPGKTATRSACAALAPARASPRCASRPTSACWPTRSPTRRSAARWSAAIGARPRAADRTRHGCTSARRAAFARLAGRDLAALPVRPAAARRAATRS